MASTPSGAKRRALSVDIDPLAVDSHIGHPISRTSSTPSGQMPLRTLGRREILRIAPQASRHRQEATVNDDGFALFQLQRVVDPLSAVNPVIGIAPVCLRSSRFGDRRDLVSGHDDIFSVEASPFGFSQLTGIDVAVADFHAASHRDPTSDDNAPEPS